MKVGLDSEARKLERLRRGRSDEWARVLDFRGITRGIRAENLVRL